MIPPPHHRTRFTVGTIVAVALSGADYGIPIRYGGCLIRLIWTLLYRVVGAIPGDCGAARYRCLLPLLLSFTVAVVVTDLVICLRIWCCPVVLPHYHVLHHVYDLRDPVVLFVDVATTDSRYGRFIRSIYPTISYRLIC